MTQIALGAGFLNPEKKELAIGMMKVLQKHNIKNIDTARVYENGGSEEVLGLIEATKHHSISTKAICGFEGAGRKETILESSEAQFSALGTEKVDVFLLHGPDVATPIEETLEAINILYKAGRFTKFGLSNFPPALVSSVHAHCVAKAYVLPTVFQVNYSLCARLSETTLLPLLRSLHFTQIQAYSPLAGGFLAKSPQQLQSSDGRWDKNSFSGRLYRGLYADKPEYMNLLRNFHQLSEETGISKGGLAGRWIRWHSMLGKEDSVIIGASSVAQLESMVEELEKGPLEKLVVERIDEMWEGVKHVAPTDNFADFLKLAKEASG